jgi:hypothetical protein
MDIPVVPDATRAVFAILTAGDGTAAVRDLVRGAARKIQ